MEDFEFVVAAMEPWLAKYFDRGVSALTELEAVAVGVWLLDAQVNNGGFDQYYFNTGGKLARATVNALRQIGARETASLLEAANADIGKLPLPEDHDGRMKALDAVANARGFSVYDTEYYEERENRIGLLAAHIRNARAAT